MADSRLRIEALLHASARQDTQSHTFARPMFDVGDSAGNRGCLPRLSTFAAGAKV